MRVLRIAALGVALSAVASGACATLQKKDALNALQESVEAYNEAFRWKNYERAAQYMPADTRAAFIAAYDEESDPLHIDDYQIVDVKVEDETSAVVRVKVRYMMLPSVTVERGALTQHWKRVAGNWILETEEGSLRDLDAAFSKAKSAPAERDAGSSPPAETGSAPDSEGTFGSDSSP